MFFIVYVCHFLDFTASIIVVDQQSMGFPDNSVGKESTCNVGDLGSCPWVGKIPGEGKGYPLQYSGLEGPQSVGLD